VVSSVAVQLRPPNRVAENRFDRPLGTGLTFRILQTEVELVSIKAEWDRLWVESEAEYFLSHAAILESWNIIHRPQGARLCCAIAMDGERLVGVLPLILNRRWAWSVASTCTPHASECCDMIVKRQPGSSELAIALLRKAIEIARPDSVYLDYVLGGTHLDIAIRANRWLRIDETWSGAVPVAVVHGETDWTSFAKALNRKYQTNVARASRRLNEQGTVTFEVLPETPASLIDWLFEHKRKWSDRTDKRGQWVFSDYYKEYLGALWASGWSRYLTFTLRLNGVLIALKLIAINTTTVSPVIITYDYDYRQFSPGNVLDEWMFKYLFDNYRTADGRFLDVIFGTGTEKFKSYWSRDNTVPVTSFLMATSRLGATAIRTREILSDLKGRIARRAPRG